MSSAIVSDADALPSPVRARLVEALRAAGAQKAVAAKLGVSVPTLQRIIAGTASIDLNLLYRIAALSGVEAPQLLTGRSSSSPVDAAQADWVQLKAYDLRNITDDGKGDPISSSPFRRDWLNTAFGTDSGLWIARLLSGYPPADLNEGDQVILRDIEVAELIDRQLCLWRELDTSRLFVGRFSAARPESVFIDGTGEYWVGRIGLAGGSVPGSVVPIGRILGRPLASIR